MPQAPDRNASLVVAASFVAEPLLAPLQLLLSEAGLALEVEFSPYNQVFQELLSPAGVLSANRQGVSVLLLRLEDFVRHVTDPAEALALLQRTVRDLGDALGHYAARSRLPTVVGLLAASPGAPSVLVRELEAGRAALAAQARALAGLTLLPEVEGDGSSERYDRLADELAHIPYTDEHYASLAIAIVRQAHALRVPAHKVLVLDCDDTLWRGVVGEDGVDGIALPESLLRVQRFALEAQARGALLCLASKNAERDVLEVLEKRREMLLRREHIVAHRINWEPKSANLASLARTLNLGTESFVFLDDSPLECARMQAELPEVVTLRLPAEGEIERFLANLWVFDKAVVTEEDARRTQLYRENALRRESEANVPDIATFIASLGVTVDIAPPTEAEWARAAQLTQRTNQFNFSTRRRTESELRQMAREGHAVLRVRVRDRFGEYGIVGLVVARTAEHALAVDTLLLSCRVLGRGVEHAMVRHLGELCAQAGASHLDLPYRRTDRNEPAAAFADSIAAQFASAVEGGTLYRLPVQAACAIAHRPGADAPAVLRAREADEAASAAPRVSASGNRSARYARLALELHSGRALLHALNARNRRPRTLAAPAAAPTRETEARLLALWERLLGIDELGIDDDYFALGGTSLLAARLFAEISRGFGLALPLTTIVAAPTVRALARQLDAAPGERDGEVVELKRARGRKLFLVHDGDGETLLYLNLARRLPAGIAVFGIGPHRLPEIALAHASIGQMAGHYVRELRRIDPQGPYLLGGMCAGGVIACEMAAQLEADGARVELVAILDAAAPGAARQGGRVRRHRLARLRQAMRDTGVARAACIAAHKAANAFAWEARQALRRWSSAARFRLLRSVLAKGRAWPAWVPPLTVREIYDSAEAHHRPTRLGDASVLLVRASSGEGSDTPYREIYTDPALGWGAIASRLSMVDVEGGHSSMLQEPFVASLAAALASCLDEQREARRAA